MVDAKLIQVLNNEEETLLAGSEFSLFLTNNRKLESIVFLLGDLGAGKTTFTKGLLRGLGHAGSVKSPTYTLLEPYELDLVKVFHFDLYRINDPQELDFLGFDEILDGPGLKLIEWADRALNWLPPPCYCLYLDYQKNNGVVKDSPGRTLRIEGLETVE